MPEKCCNVREMLTEHLWANGYDGLLSENSDCACQLDDLIPCMEDCSFCKPAHYVPCNDPNECEYGDSPTHFHMEPGPNIPRSPPREGGEVMNVINCYRLEGNMWMAEWELDYMVYWY